MIPNLTNGSSGVAQQGGQPPASSSIDPMASEQTFLKLLVAQLKNQDPLQPQDATQFVAQLAQFQLGRTATADETRSGCHQEFPR
jgi:flagellar basal-body rod modification protein FlgD